jgi:hypothetical protein
MVDGGRSKEGCQNRKRISNYITGRMKPGKLPDELTIKSHETPCTRKKEE